MKKSCIDCDQFTHCGKATRAWRTAWNAYPEGMVESKNEENRDKRIALMETQFSICHEQQMTFQTLKIVPRLET